MDKTRELLEKIRTLQESTSSSNKAILKEEKENLWLEIEIKAEEFEN